MDQRRPTRSAGNLPTPLTGFVGRRRELAEVRRRLARSRLVTLTGAGGLGKTRLAVEVARESRRGFTGGAWFADLAPVSELASESSALPLEKLIRHYSLDELDAAAEDMHHGRTIKPVVRF